jgi:hypothetical protein
MRHKNKYNNRDGRFIKLLPITNILSLAHEADIYSGLAVS